MIDKSNSTLFKFENIYMQFKNGAFLQVENFEIKKNQCTILTGRNGSGKTTLLKILAGLLKPKNGRICYRGEYLAWQSAKKYLLKKIVYVHQHPYLFNTTVKNNIGYGLRYKKISRTRKNEIIKNILGWSGLKHLAERNAKMLSGGEKQQVALARAWSVSPDILLLDEPTSNMDTFSNDQTLFMMQRMKSEGISIVITTHEQQKFIHLSEQLASIDKECLTIISTGNYLEIEMTNQFSKDNVLHIPINKIR